MVGIPTSVDSRVPVFDPWGMLPILGLFQFARARQYRVLGSRGAGLQVRRLSACRAGALRRQALVPVLLLVTIPGATLSYPL